MICTHRQSTALINNYDRKHPTSMNTNLEIIALALHTAQGQVGQSEVPKGSNSGPMVDKYLRSVGLSPGYPWCQAFVHWCYEQAATEHNVDNPVTKTAGVQDCWNHTLPARRILAERVLHEPAIVCPGDQFILLFGNGNGHTGIVEKVEGQILHTIEGNSNINGGREGYQVVRHQRSITEPALKGFIHYV